MPDVLRVFLHVFRKGGGVPALVFMLFALFVLGIAYKEHRKAWLLANEGVTVMADVLSRDRVETVNEDGKKDVKLYVSYRFFPEGGDGITGRESVSYPFFAQETRQVPLVYWRKDPSLREIEIGSTADGARWSGRIGGLLFAIGAGFAVLAFVRAWRGAAIWRIGRERRARIIAHELPFFGKQRKSRHLVWRDEEGGEGRSMPVEPSWIGLYPVGEQIRVIVDPSGRRAAWWSGDLGALNVWKS